GRTRSRTTNVEGTHRQLCTRFTDGLGGNHTHGFAAVDHGATAQIAAVAVSAQTMTRFAGERRADLDFVNAKFVDEVDVIFGEQGARRDGSFLRVGVHDIHRGHTTKNPVTQRFDHFTAFNQRLQGVTLGGAAVVLGDDEVLRNVDQTAGQVTRVGSLKSRIGQTFTRTVSRDEVLQYVQPFTEVRCNRRFDNGAIRLGHQTAHTGQLANLGCGTPRPGVGHHVDGVEGLLTHFLAEAVDDRFGGQLFHHGLADTVAGLAPDVHHVVVAFLSGDQTRRVLLVDFLHLAGGLRQDFFLDRGHDHDAHGNGNTPAGRQAET